MTNDELRAKITEQCTYLIDMAVSLDHSSEGHVCGAECNQGQEVALEMYSNIIRLSGQASPQEMADWCTSITKEQAAMIAATADWTLSHARRLSSVMALTAMSIRARALMKRTGG